MSVVVHTNLFTFVYRARPVISVNAGLEVNPTILNPEEKICELPDTGVKVSW